MARRVCDACGTRVSIAGGIENLWTFEGDSTKGMTIEFDDGTEQFLCFTCIERLPPEPTPTDVDAIETDESDG